jgi:hypothetical protein
MAGKVKAEMLVLAERVQRDDVAISAVEWKEAALQLAQYLVTPAPKPRRKK